MNENNANKFLKLFNEIEKHLNDLNHSTDYIPFTQLVIDLSKKNSIIRRYKDDLIQYSKLRNAIVHEVKNLIIAEPHLIIVNEIQKIKELLFNPQRVLPMFQFKVFYCNFDDSISTALNIMTENSFSQIPILFENGLLSVLTNNTISRWLGNNLKDEIVDLKETKIEDVLKFTETNNNYKIIKKETDLYTVLDMFYQNLNTSGNNLDAILISENGKPTESFLGLIANNDIPKILSVIGVKR